MIMIMIMIKVIVFIEKSAERWSVHKVRVKIVF